MQENKILNLHLSRVSGKTGFEEICEMIYNVDDTICNKHGWSIINSTLNHPQ